MPAFPGDLLAAVNGMERGADPLTVARAALVHYALTSRPTPNYMLWLNAEQYADAILAALWRRGLLNDWSQP